MQRGAARLEVVTGRAAGTSIVVEDVLVIGRHADGAGPLANDEEISRTHARITLDSSGYLAIEDLGSTNGTFVNGLRISGPKTLAEGDGIELGGATLVVREVPAPAATGPTTAPQLQPPPARVPTEREPGSRAQAPAARAAAAPDAPLPPLALRVEIDFAAREARILLDDASEPVRLKHADGAWRVVPPES
jgi:predicted component of type VI protein secretion system